MDHILFSTTSVLFFITIAINAISFLSIFEGRDYNAKRLLIYLRETKSGKNFLLGRIAFVKWIVIFAYVLTVFFPIDNFYHITVFLLYVLLTLNIVRHVSNRDFTLPRFTKGIIAALIATAIIEILLYSFAVVDQFLWLLLIDKFLLLILSFFLVVISVFSDFGRDYVINRAIAAISKQPKLLSIAVVGSYGRGSTKEFISQILSIKYNVLTEHSSFSNSLGIAKTINSGLNNKSQIFIAEINDYNSEDVREMCALINPKIVVTTGINEQKISLFGSLENILKSKLEAVSSLGRDGIALFNGNSKLALELARKVKKKKFVYSVYSSGENASVVATNVKESKLSFSFDVQVLGKKYKLTGIKLLGRQNIENLLPAIFIGVYAGVDFTQIRDALLKITPLPSSMEPLKAKSGAILIDDTHNANVNSVERVVSYLKLYRGKKVLILEPLVELGKNASKIHLELGEEIGKVCDVVFLTNDNYYPAISSGISEVNPNCEFKVATPAKIIEYVKYESKREDVIAFAGHEASLALSRIPSEKIYRKEEEIGNRK